MAEGSASRVDGASETSPLLGEQRKPSLHHGRGPLLADDDDDDDDQRGLLSRKTKKRTVTASKVCCYGLLALLAATGVALAVVHVWIGNLVNRTDSMLAMAERGFVWEGPYDVRFDDRGAQVDVAVAFDVRKALNWSAGSKRERFEHRVAARIVSRTPYAFVDVPSLYFDSPEGTLAETSTSLRVPLFYNNVRLTNTTVDLPFEVYPALKEYAIDVYERRKWRVRLNIVDLFVQPQGKGFLGWIAKRVGTTTISALAIEQSGHRQSCSFATRTELTSDSSAVSAESGRLGRPAHGHARLGSQRDNVNLRRRHRQEPGPIAAFSLSSPLCVFGPVPATGISLCPDQGRW